MAASSGFVPSFSHKSRSVHGGAATAFSSSSLVRLHGGEIIRRWSSLTTTQMRGGASFTSPRCRAGFDEALLTAHFPSTIPAADKFARERCSIVVIGLSGPSIPVETHEKLAIVESEWPRAIEELCKLDDIEEAAVLSTCSRLEIYVLALCGGSGVSQVTNWISKSSGVPASEICKHGVVLYDRDAVEHLFKVSSGLDSLVLDESQILAQVQEAHIVGSSAMGFGMMMRTLFLDAIIVGRRVRSETSIAAAAGAVCVSSAAVELALMKLSESSSSLDIARILVVGAGKMGELVIKHLVARGCKKMVVVNRSQLRVKFMDLMKEEGVEIIYKPVSEMYECAAAADVVFTATNSEKPLFLKQHVEKLAPAQQQQQQRLFVDMSVPRNVGSCVASLGTAAIVYNVDDLKNIVYDAAVAAASNEDRLMKARSIIDEETNGFEVQRDLSARRTVESFRESLEEIRVAWLEKRLSEFGGDITEEQRKSIEDYSWERINKRLKESNDRIARIIQEGESKWNDPFKDWISVNKNT